MTGSKRINRIESELKKALSKIIFNDLNSDKLKFASVNRIKVSPDLSVANVYFSSITASKDDSEEIGRMFRENTKNIRMLISKYVSLRIVPELRFFYDDTLDNVYRIEELLNSVKKKDGE